MASNICYSGIGSLEGGTHTQKEFVDVMTKHFAQKCSQYTKSLKCKACKKVKKQSTHEVMKQIEAHKKNKTYKISKRTENSIKKLSVKCDECKKKNTRKCTLKEYIAFSGAEKGKCPS